MRWRRLNAQFSVGFAIRSEADMEELLEELKQHGALFNIDGESLEGVEFQEDGSDEEFQDVEIGTSIEEGPGGTK